MILSATGLAFVGLLGKFGMEKFSIPTLIFIRYLISFTLCLVFLWITNELKGIHLGNIRMHLLRTVCVLGAQYSFFYYLQSGTLLNASALLNTGPVFIPLIERFFLKGKVGKSTWIGVIVSFIGVICILQPDREVFSFLGLVGLLSGFFQGASQVVFGKNSQIERSDVSLFFLFLFSSIFSFFPFFFLEFSLGEVQWDPRFLLLLFLLGVASVSNQIFRALSYQNSTPSRLAPFIYISVIFAGVFDWAIFHNIPNSLSLVGVGLVLLGGFLKIYLRFLIRKI